MDALDAAYDNLEQLMDEESSPCYDLHLYAAYLLAEFKEKRAFPKLCTLLQLDENGTDFLWGDILTDRYYVLLRDTFNGDLQSLCKVIENKRYNKWGRSATLRAYGLLVRDKTIPREDLITYLRYLIADVYTNMVHYRAREWLLKLQDLLATYSADIPDEKAAYKRLVRQAICG